MTVHEHPYGWSQSRGIETFEHEHERGEEPHEHVLRDGGTDIKRTTWSNPVKSVESVTGRYVVQVRLDAGWADANSGSHDTLEQARMTLDAEREMMGGTYRIVLRVTSEIVVK